MNLPQVIPAIVLKAYAFGARVKEGDLLDLWKLLECAHAEGLKARDWLPASAQKRDATQVLRTKVIAQSGPGATICRRRGWLHPRIVALAMQQLPVDR